MLYHPAPLPPAPDLRSAGGLPPRPTGSAALLARAIGAIGAIVLVAVCAAPSAGGDRNPLAYLDARLDPYYVDREFPKLTTPQWFGEPGVRAVVVLAIDDMRDTAKYEAYLRPILDRLARIKPRAGMSIMTCRVEADDPQLAKWLKEGVSIEVHTYDHPCPCLQGGDFAQARETYERCVDLMGKIPGNRPVAFRMPCCDSQNTPSPRFWAEIFNRTTGQGNYLSIDTSVFQLFTRSDPEVIRWATGENDQERFRRYLPFPSFVNTIENYPYPYVIGKLCWEFPCMVPSDWEAQYVQQPFNPRTVDDMQQALDATVAKQGVFNLVFHPHGWIRNGQVVQLIEQTQQRHGDAVRFLSFREAQEKLDRHLLAGQPLRRRDDGGDNGVRLLDLDRDGYLDVVIGNDELQVTRIWHQESGSWSEVPLPFKLVAAGAGGPRDQGVRFGFDRDGNVTALGQSPQQQGAWKFREGRWEPQPGGLDGLRLEGGQVVTVDSEGRDAGVRLRDIDGDGVSELLVANPRQSAIFQRTASGSGWSQLPFALPAGAWLADAAGRDAGLRFADLNEDGFDDLLVSNEQRSGVYLRWVSKRTGLPTRQGWLTALEAPRSSEQAFPMISRAGTNNGAWIHSRHLWVQNEDTHRLPDKVDRRSFDQLLAAHRRAQGEIPPPRNPADALKTMQLPPGFRLELAASEPLVQDPVAFDWGPDGRLWVVEMADYPMGIDGKGTPGGRLKRLTDLDGDGRYDTSETWADDLPFPNGVKAWKDGCLVTAAPEILFLADRDGDGKAEIREPLFRGFIEGNQQHRANGLRWGLDQWLHVANGDSGGNILSLKTGQQLGIGGRDLRLRPESGEMQLESGQTQYGRNRDDWGNWFGGNNSNPMWHYVISDRVLRRNPHVPAPDARKHVSVAPGAAPVFPASQTLARFNDYNKANRFTSACSPMVYRDELLGRALRGQAFICEPVHNLVHREVMRLDGVTFSSQRAEAEQESEFLASSDNWFRPVMIRTGPDGCLWIADMYRFVIEHPEWIPADWQKKLDLRAGHDRGRIYRIVPAEVPPRPLPRLSEMSAVQLATALDSPNGWQRDTIQQLLAAQGPLSPETREQLAAVARQGMHAEARVQALYALHGNDTLKPAEFVAALNDSHVEVRRHAIRIAGGAGLADHPELRPRLEALGDDPDPRVQLELAVAVSQVRSPWAYAQLAATLSQTDDSYLRAAALSSLNAGNVQGVLAELRRAPEETLSRVIATALGTLPREQSIAALTPLIGRAAAQQEGGFGLLEGILASLRRNRIALADLPEAARLAVQQAYRRAAQLAAAREAQPEARVAAVNLLSRDDGAAGERARRAAQLAALLVPEEPGELQAAAVEALTRIGGADAGTALVARWQDSPPQLRSQIADALSSRADWLQPWLAQAAASGRPLHLAAAQRQVLLGHQDADVRRLAAKLLGGQTSNRAQVLADHQGVLELAADAQRGRQLFAKRCAACHRLEGQGTPIGPDLSALTNKSPENLLKAILAPNLAVESKYLSYLAQTKDGRQFSGLIVTESSTSLTIAGTDGKQQTLLRSELELLKSLGNSFMPEGLEKDLQPQDLADVMAYVREAKSANP